MSDLAEQKQSAAPDSPWLERMRTSAGEMPRAAKRLVMIAFDFIALILIIWIILSVRFNRFFVPNLDQALVMLAAPVIAIPIFIRLGLYRSVLRYLPDRAIWTVDPGDDHRNAGLGDLGVHDQCHRPGRHPAVYPDRLLGGRNRRHRGQPLWRQAISLGQTPGASACRTRR